MRSPVKRLEDILAAIKIIQEFSQRGQDAFADDLGTQSVILRYLQVIGEAAYRMPDSVRKLAPLIPWKSIAGLRHVLVHDYFEIDLELAWSTVEHDLDALEREVSTLLASIRPPG